MVGWEKRIASLVDGATRLSSNIQQKAYSKSYAATLPTPDKGFDPARMQDILKSQPHRMDSPVSCAVALGLAYTVQQKGGRVEAVQMLPSEVIQTQSLHELLDD